MTEKEKAEELIKKFEPLVYPFLGSGMLTNTPSDRVILMNSKQCAIITVRYLIDNSTYPAPEERYDEWMGVLKELERM